MIRYILFIVVILLLGIIFTSMKKWEKEIDKTIYASFYGKKFHGKLTANGETYNMNMLTAASPHIPFGTRIVVRNMNNGKTVTVRINDRGPFQIDKHGKVLRPLQPHNKRVLDLSRAAFERISPLSAGVIPIEYTILD